jgi:hypothetical protein
MIWSLWTGATSLMRSRSAIEVARGGRTNSQVSGIDQGQENDAVPALLSMQRITHVIVIKAIAALKKEKGDLPNVIAEWVEVAAEALDVEMTSDTRSDSNGVEGGAATVSIAIAAAEITTVDSATDCRFRGKPKSDGFRSEMMESKQQRMQAFQRHKYKYMNYAQ